MFDRAYLPSTTNGDGVFDRRHGSRPAKSQGEDGPARVRAECMSALCGRALQVVIEEIAPCSRSNTRKCSTTSSIVTGPVHLVRMILLALSIWYLTGMQCIRFKFLSGSLFYLPRPANPFNGIAKLLLPAGGQRAVRAGRGRDRSHRHIGNDPRRGRRGPSEDSAPGGSSRIGPGVRGGRNHRESMYGECDLTDSHRQHESLSQQTQACLTEAAHVEYRLWSACDSAARLTEFTVRYLADSSARRGRRRPTTYRYTFGPWASAPRFSTSTRPSSPSPAHWPSDGLSTVTA